MRKFCARWWKVDWWIAEDLDRWRYALHTGSAVPEQEIYQWRRILAAKPYIAGFLLLLAAPALAQIEAKYSRVSLEGLQALSGDKVPRSAAIYSVKACNVGSAEEPLTDARLMMMSPVPVDDQRIPVMERARKRGVRKLLTVRNFLGAGAIGLGLFGNGKAAGIAAKATGIGAAGVELIDRQIGDQSTVPIVPGQLSDSGPRYVLAAGECRSGWFVGLFVREFTQGAVRFDPPKRVEPQNRPTIRTIGASFEISRF